jgi:hypothetical protein
MFKRLLLASTVALGLMTPFSVASAAPRCIEWVRSADMYTTSPTCVRWRDVQRRRMVRHYAYGPPVHRRVYYHTYNRQNTYSHQRYRHVPVTTFRSVTPWLPTGHVRYVPQW